MPDKAYVYFVGAQFIVPIKHPIIYLISIIRVRIKKTNHFHKWRIRRRVSSYNTQIYGGIHDDPPYLFECNRLKIFNLPRAKYNYSALPGQQ